MQRGRARGDGIVRWLLPASVLHAAIVLFAAASSRGSPPRSEQSQPGSSEPESSLELLLFADEEWSRPARSGPAPPTPSEAAPPPANDEPRAARAAVDPSPPGTRRLGAVSTSPSTRVSPELASIAAERHPDAPAPSTPSAAANEPSPEASPTLSLDQLGIGNNPFLSLPIEPLSKEEQANARLYAALHPSHVGADRQRGFGPKGPVLDAARRLVLADDGLVEASAVLEVRVDGAGHVSEVHLLEAASQIKAWQMIAARLAQALNPVALRRGQSSQGWGLKLRLASSVELPSGAAPGLRASVLGQRVAGSGRPGSTSLELSPTSKLDIKEPIDSVGRHMDHVVIVEVGLLKLKADLTDLGAPARRVVEVAVLSLDVPAAP